MTKDEILDRAIPVEKLFSALPEVRLQPFFDRLYGNGERILLRKLRKVKGETGQLFRVYNESRGFYSIGEIIEKDGMQFFRLKKLF